MYSVNISNYHLKNLYFLLGELLNLLKFISAKRMKQFVLVLFMVIFTYTLSARTYYVSNSGDDSKEGTTTQKAWKTCH